MNDIQQKRILFVDDEPLVLNGLERTLRKMRHEWDMTFVAGGKEALALLERTPMDVIVTDLKMPEMDGTRLLAQVRKRHPHIVRIILSGHLEHEMSLRSVQMAHQSLAKPCDAAILKQTIAKIFALRDILTDDSIKKTVSQIQQLPSLPSVYMEIVKEIQSTDPSLRVIGEIIARDVSMTAKILQVVNSAFFGLSRKISSTHEAVVMLGTETIKSLVLSIKIFSEYSQKRFSWFSIDALFNHSMAVSACAKTIAKQAKLDNSLLDSALLAGLLHDLGKLILATNFRDAYQQVLTEARHCRRPLWELECDAFGTSHAEIGAYLMGLWSLENAIIESIAFHHRPAQSMNPNVGLLTAVHVGDAMDHEGPAAGDEPAQSLLDTGYLDNLGITQQLEEWRGACGALSERACNERENSDRR